MSCPQKIDKKWCLEKVKTMLFSAHFLYRLEDLLTTGVTILKDLGVMLDFKLNFNSHAWYVVSPWFRLHDAISILIKCFLNVFLFFVRYRSIALPKHDFCFVIWDCLGAIALKNVAPVQKTFARIFHFKFPSHDSYAYDKVLKQFQVTNLVSRRCSRDLEILFKYMHSYCDISSLVLSTNYQSHTGWNVRYNCIFHVNHTDVTSPSDRLQDYFNHLESDDIDIFKPNLPQSMKCLLRVLK